MVIPDITPYQPILPTPTAIAIAKPFGCLHAPDDYSRLHINGHRISQRKFFMLQHAYNLYGGVIHIIEQAITQGCYNDLEPLRFGTHSGGGVVDISVIDRSLWILLYEEIEPLILAMRMEGFAAWLRDFDELSPGSPIHIHAAAVGIENYPLRQWSNYPDDTGIFAVLTAFLNKVATLLPARMES